MPTTCSRRDFLITTATLSAGLTFSGALNALRAAETSQDFNTAYSAIVKGASVVPEKIKLEIDPYIENGARVFYRASVDHPMTADNFVKHLYLLSTQNPFAHIATFDFTPMSGLAAVAGRMRLAKSQDVVALAELSNQRLYIAKRYVEVAIGGCET